MIKHIFLKNPVKIIFSILLIYLLKSLFTLSYPIVVDRSVKVVNVVYSGNKMLVFDGKETHKFDKTQPIIDNIIYYKDYGLLGLFLIISVTIFIGLISCFISDDSTINWGLKNYKINKLKERIEIIPIDNTYFYVDSHNDRVLHRSAYSDDSVSNYTLEEYIKSPENYYIYTKPIKKRNNSIDQILN